MSLTAFVQELFTKEPVGDREVELESQNLKVRRDRTLWAKQCTLLSNPGTHSAEITLRTKHLAFQASREGGSPPLQAVCAIFRKMTKAQLSVRWTEGTREEFCPPTHNWHMPHKAESHTRHISLKLRLFTNKDHYRVFSLVL